MLNIDTAIYLFSQLNNHTILVHDIISYVNLYVDLKLRKNGKKSRIIISLMKKVTVD